MHTKSPAAPSGLKKAGVRELSKQESQHKIMIAARELFAELGYDGATLRQIAAKAGLTVGALFNHVTDKRDLIHLIFNEEVDALTDKALASPRPYQKFSEKILAMTEHYYRLFAIDPVLSRILLSEILVETPGMHLERNLSIRARLLKGVERVVFEAQQTGEIQAVEHPQIIAHHIFFAHAASLRLWLASSAHPEWRSGHRQYERFLRLQMDGLSHPPKSADASLLAGKTTRAKPHK